MKTQMTLEQLAAELTRQTATRKDYVAPQGALIVRPVANDIEIDGLNGQAVGVTPFAHGQLADHLGVPRKYYERMRIEQPALLATNLNTWLASNRDERRMVRTLDGRMRAFLSPKYRPLDNFDLGNTVLPVLLAERAEIVSAAITETRMYIKAILPRLSDELPEGLAHGVGHNFMDRGRVAAAVTISNSEVGDGTLSVIPSVFTFRCTNLAQIAAAAMKKFHVGRGHDALDSYEVFRDETRQADDHAFWLKVQDVARSAFDETKFRAAIERMKAATETPIVSGDLPKVVEVAVGRLGLADGLSGSILTQLARSGDLTQWGLSSAITRVANDHADYEGATELERVGGRVIDLPASDWKAIAEAA